MLFSFPCLNDQGLQMNRTLLSLSLHANKIGDKGAIKIAEVSVSLLCLTETTPYSCMGNIFNALHPHTAVMVASYIPIQL